MERNCRFDVSATRGKMKMLSEVYPECWSGIQTRAKLHTLLETCLCTSPTCPPLPGLTLRSVICVWDPRAGEGAQGTCAMLVSQRAFPVERRTLRWCVVVMVWVLAPFSWCLGGPNDFSPWAGGNYGKCCTPVSLYLVRMLITSLYLV